MEETGLRCARQARAGVREVRRLLTAPTAETLEMCQPYLAESITRLKELEMAVRAGENGHGKVLRTELRRLRKELAHANALLEHAASFHSGWMRLLASLTGGYNPQGEPARREPIRRISVQG